MANLPVNMFNIYEHAYPYEGWYFMTESLLHATNDPSQLTNYRPLGTRLKLISGEEIQVSGIGDARILSGRNTYLELLNVYHIESLLVSVISVSKLIEDGGYVIESHMSNLFVLNPSDTTDFIAQAIEVGGFFRLEPGYICTRDHDELDPLEISSVF